MKRALQIETILEAEKPATYDAYFSKIEARLLNPENELRQAKFLLASDPRETLKSLPEED